MPTNTPLLIVVLPPFSLLQYTTHVLLQVSRMCLHLKSTTKLDYIARQIITFSSAEDNRGYIPSPGPLLVLERWCGALIWVFPTIYGFSVVLEDEEVAVDTRVGW